MVTIAGMEISDEIIKGLKLRYPNVKSVDDDLALMALWLAKHPAKQIKRPIRFIENWLKKSTPKLAAVPTVVRRWWDTEEGTMRQAEALGMSARPGESMFEFRNRMIERIGRAAA